MPDFILVTDKELERARKDAAFRQQLIAQNLDFLLATLNKLRKANSSSNPAGATQIREAVQLAVKLADILHKLSDNSGSPRAA
jgi:hypothetical protein